VSLGAFEPSCFGGALLLKVGLTGGIASGKSAVGEMFVALGAHLVQADRIAHQLMLPGEPVYNEVVRNFGRAILNRDGSVNRSRLAELAFGSNNPGPHVTPNSASTNPTPANSAQTQSRVSELNRIVHPAVIRAQEAWMEEVGRSDRNAIAIVEAALIIEAGAAKSFNRLIVVTSNDDQRIARFAARQKIDVEAARKEVSRRMAAQMPESEKAKLADYVIDNSGSLEQTQAQVKRVWEELRELK
jgi:dephospho-CoA kinase